MAFGNRGGTSERAGDHVERARQAHAEGAAGTAGGFVRMNGGAYGREVSDILVTAKVVMRNGEVRTIGKPDLDYSYRHSNLPADSVVVEALFQGEPGDPDAIGAEMDAIARA